MYIKIRNKSYKIKLEVMILMFSILLFAYSTYALTFLWRGSVGATITTEVQYIIVTDSEGNEVISINFGNVVPGSKVEISLIIKNVSPNSTITISWSSTLQDVTNKITDSWLWYDYSPTWPYGVVGWRSFPATLIPGQSIETKYSINIASDAPLETFSWTLYIIPA